MYLCYCAGLCLITLCDPMDCSRPGSSVHRDSPDKNTGVGYHTLLQGISPTQGLNQDILNCRLIHYQLSYPGSPHIHMETEFQTQINQHGIFREDQLLSLSFPPCSLSPFRDNYWADFILSWAWNTKLSSTKSSRVMSEKTLVTANALFQQPKMALYTWTSADGQNQSQIDYVLWGQRWRSSKQSAKIRQELTVAQIMKSLLPNSDLY